MQTEPISKITNEQKNYALVTSNLMWKIFSNFVAFSQYPNFKESHQVRAHGTKMVLEQYVKWLDVDNEKSPDVSAI